MAALLMAAAALTAMACQGDGLDVAADGPSAGDLSAAADSVALTFRLRASRAAGSDDSYFKNEYAVSRIAVCLFDADTRRKAGISTATNLTETEQPYGVQTYDITYLVRDLRVKTGRYDIFIVANYDGPLDGVESEDEFLNTVDATTYESGIVASLPDTGPVMTSSPTAFIGVDLTPYAGRDYVIQADIQRAVAKLQIGVLQNSFHLVHDGEPYAELHVTNYKLVNMNRQYFLFQHTRQMSRFDAQPDFVFPADFGEFTGGQNQYVLDPLFSEKQPVQASVQRYGQQCAAWYGNFTTDNFAAIPAAGNFSAAYVLENTAYQDCQKNGFSPGVVFKCSVSPPTVYLYDQASHTIHAESRGELWPATIYLYRYRFYGSLQAVNQAGGLTLDELRQYTDAELQSYGIKQCHFNQGAYETFYTYWIEHRDAQGDPMGPMRYAVVRNHHYRMTVSGITGIGFSEIRPDVLRDNYPNSFQDIVVE